MFHNKVIFLISQFQLYFDEVHSEERYCAPQSNDDYCNDEGRFMLCFCNVDLCNGAGEVRGGKAVEVALMLFLIGFVK